MFKYKVKVTDISYNAPGYAKAVLPKIMDLNIEAEGQDDLEDKIADKISDITGFCHYHYTYQILKIS